MKASAKVDLARDLARGLIEDADVLAVMLVGSVATGLDSEDSDVDLAVVIDREFEIFEEYQEHGGIRVGIERYPARHFLRLPEDPVLNLEALRNCGRYARGVVLESRWPRLESIQRAWRRARLDPAEAEELLSLAETYLTPERSDGAGAADRLWELQGAAASIAILTLALEPCRFQKPKWLMQDLVHTGHHELAGAVAAIFMGGEADAQAAARGLAATEHHLNEACRSAGFPPLSFDPEQGERRVYVYQTYRDAVSLKNDGDPAGCLFTAVYALRLMNAYLQGDTPDVEHVDEAWLESWRSAAITAVMPRGLPADEALETVLSSLRDKVGWLRGQFR